MVLICLSWSSFSWDAIRNIPRRCESNIHVVTRQWQEAVVCTCEGVVGYKEYISVAFWTVSWRKNKWWKNINLEISVRIQTPYCMLRIRTLSEQRALGKYGWVLLPPSPCIVGHCLIIHLKFSERLLSRSGRCWKPESLTWGNELWQWLPNLGGKLGHSMGYHSGLRGIHQGRKRSLPKKVWHTAYVSTLV